MSLRGVGRVAGAVGLILVVGSGLAACDPGTDDADSDGAASTTGMVPSGSMASTTIPEGGFGLGRTATEAEIAAWDIDVGPSGKGLPVGSGTVAEGAEVYRLQCQACHGATGIEGPNTVLVSSEPLDEFAFGADPGMRSTIGNYWPYATTVFDYTRRSMPFDRPGSLTDDEVYAVTAWLLWMNGLIEEDAVMDAQSLPAVRMPAREHFVPSEDVSLGALP